MSRWCSTVALSPDAMAEWAFVSLGSNLGDRAHHLSFGREHLAALPASTLIAHSEIEETEPLGPVSQGPYFNQMVLLETDLDPRDLLAHCHEIEDRCGRTRTVRWGPRTLDLDIVRLGDLRLDDPALTIPHPELANRPFWVRQLAELFPHSWCAATDPGFPAWAEVAESRRAHVLRVAGLLGAWAVATEKSHVERNRWLKAAFLHDALRDASANTISQWVHDPDMAVAVQHGPAAANLAASHGESDREVLDAVRFHSVGYAAWGQLGRMLYMADYLEPGRGFRRAQRARLAAEVPAAPERVLLTVATLRLQRAIDKRHRLQQEGIDFWNAVVSSR